MKKKRRKLNRAQRLRQAIRKVLRTYDPRNQHNGFHKMVTSHKAAMKLAYLDLAFMAIGIAVCIAALIKGLVCHIGTIKMLILCGAFVFVLGLCWFMLEFFFKNRNFNINQKQLL